MSLPKTHHESPLQTQGGLKIRQDIIYGRIISLKPRTSIRYLLKAADINNSVLQPSFKGSRLSPRSLSAARLIGKRQIVNQEEKAGEIQLSPSETFDLPLNAAVACRRFCIREF